MFKNLVRHSRVFSLPEIEARSEHVPAHQVLKTTSSNHHRHNWGLKYTLPSKASSVLVTQEALDSAISMPQVEYGGRHARRLEKFSETGAPVRPFRPHSEFSSMFCAGKKPGKTIASLSKKERQQLLKDASTRGLEYKKYVQSLQNGKTEAQPHTRGIAERFCGLDSSAAYTYESRKTPSTVFGLSYALKGTVHNTKDGLVYAHTIPGRVLPVGSVNQKRSHPAAAAGFSGQLQNPKSRRQDNIIISQQRVTDMHVSSAESNIDGELLVKFNEIH